MRRLAPWPELCGPRLLRLFAWQVSAGLAEAAAEADLVVLEGMGRSIETNLHARFRCGSSQERRQVPCASAGPHPSQPHTPPSCTYSCDSLNLGMIKHPEVAQALGGRLYDCVCQFRRAGSA